MIYTDMFFEKVEIFDLENDVIIETDDILGESHNKNNLLNRR